MEDNEKGKGNDNTEVVEAFIRELTNKAQDINNGLTPRADEDVKKSGM